MENMGHIRHIRSLRPVRLAGRDTHTGMLTDDAEVWEPLHHLFIGWHCRNVALKEIGFSGPRSFRVNYLKRYDALSTKWKEGRCFEFGGCQAVRENTRGSETWSKYAL
jgi:hypothetical protein